MKKLFTLLFVALTATVVNAQSNKNYEAYPHNFISVQGGASAVFSDPDLKDLVSPAFAISFGNYINPNIGLRLKVQGYEGKGKYILGDISSKYDYKYFDANFDVLVNLTNILSKKQYYPFSVALVAGVGLSFADDYEIEDSTFPTVDLERNTGSVLTPNVRLGLLLDYSLSKHWGINLEMGVSAKDDKFNDKFNDKLDWHATAMVGLTYKFNQKKKANSDTSASMAGMDYQNTRDTNTEVANNRQITEKKPVKEEKKAVTPAPVKKEKVEKAVFFKLNSAKVSAAEEVKVKEIAEWMKAHPNAKLNIAAYADKKTGTPSVNLNMSKVRGYAVKDMLVKKYGVKASAITVDYKGDTVQPYAENAKNRVTILVGEE